MGAGKAVKAYLMFKPRESPTTEEIGTLVGSSGMFVAVRNDVGHGKDDDEGTDDEAEQRAWWWGQVKSKFRCPSS